MSYESILSVVSSILAMFISSFIRFSLQTLSLISKMSTDWLLCNSIVSIGLCDVMVRS